MCSLLQTNCMETSDGCCKLCKVLLFLKQFGEEHQILKQICKNKNMRIFHNLMHVIFNCRMLIMMYNYYFDPLYDLTVMAT